MTPGKAGCPRPGLRAGSLYGGPLFASFPEKGVLSSHASLKPRSTLMPQPTCNCSPFGDYTSEVVREGTNEP